MSFSFSNVLIVALCIIVVGCLPSTQARCQSKDVYKCHFSSPAHDDCPVYQKSIDCIEAAKKGCTGTDFLKYATSKLNYYKKNQAICPDLEDGKCHFGLTNVCMKKVNHANPGPNKCQILKTHYHEAWTCLNDVKFPCYTEAGIKYVDGEIHFLNIAAKKCKVAIDEDN